MMLGNLLPDFTLSLCDSEREVYLCCMCDGQLILGIPEVNV